MPKYCPFWWLLDDEKGFSVCRFCVFLCLFGVFRVSVLRFSCICFMFLEWCLGVF